MSRLDLLQDVVAPGENRKVSNGGARLEDLATGGACGVGYPLYKHGDGSRLKGHEMVDPPRTNTVA